MLCLLNIYRVSPCVNYRNFRLVLGRNSPFSDTSLGTRSSLFENSKVQDHLVPNDAHVLEDSSILLEDCSALDLKLEAVGGDFFKAMIGSPLLDQIFEVLYFIRRVSFYLNRVVETRHLHV